MATRENDNLDNGPDYNGDDESFPELDAIYNILERARQLAAKHHTDLQLNFHVRLKGLSTNKVKEKYIFSGAPADKKLDPNSPEYKKITEELKQIVIEEMKISFPDASEDLSSRELKNITNIHKELESEVKEPNSDINQINNNQAIDPSPFIQLKRFEDL